MAGMIRKFLPVDAPATAGSDDDNEEYSFAIEYTGPLVSYDIPRVVPIDATRVQVAAAAAAPLFDDSPPPLVQPIRPKGKTLSKNLSRESSGSRRIEKSVPPVTSPTSSDRRADSVHDDKQSPRESDAVSSGRDGAPATVTSRFSEAVSLQEACTDSTGSSRPCRNPDRWSSSKSTESGRRSSAVSSEFSSHYEDAGSPCNTRTSVVTFRYPESNDAGLGESGRPEVWADQHRERSERAGRRGSCYRCEKGNKFTRKEACLVCGAKYCGNCVVRAMGSMPEGRKCVTCIGRPVRTSKRGSLGKKSLLLRQLFVDQEIKRILESETACEANRLPADRVVVNGRPLRQEELLLLQNCPNPPKKLKPGSYWYDKVAGLWGKEGKPPCQIVTPQLNVGDTLPRKASHGNTDVLINNREITKRELLMLRLAGVQCTGHTSFWVNADGSCVEEGHNNEKGKIWGKVRTKMYCVAVSLPILSEPEKPSGGVRNAANHPEPPHKLLLVGCTGSGTSLIYKQAKILYNIPFSDNERQHMKFMIRCNLYAYFGVLFECRQRFEKECLIKMGKRACTDDASSFTDNIADKSDANTAYSISKTVKSFSDWLLNFIESGNMESISPDVVSFYAPLVEESWKDTAIQATYSRVKELKMLPRGAGYFLDRVVEICGSDYEPSDMDILSAEGITPSSAPACMEYSYPKSKEDCFDHLYQHDPSSRYELIRAHPQNLGEKCKWLEMFADAELVMFCACLTDYNEFMGSDDEGARANKMMLSKELFECIATHPMFCHKPFLLILNKQDLLDTAIAEAPLARCSWLNGFNPPVSFHQNGHSRGTGRAQLAAHYIASKFKKLFYDLTRRKLYASMVCGLEQETVDEALRYGREILRWEEEKPNFSSTEWSSNSNVTATT